MALPAWEVPENVGPGQSWGAGERGGRSPAPLPPSLDKWARGRRRARGSSLRRSAAPPASAPPPRPALPAGGAGPGSAASRFFPWDRGIAPLFFPSHPPCPGSRLGEGSRGSPSRPGSGRLVAASGTRGGGPPGALLPLPSLPPWEALEDFLPLRPPRCPPDMVGHLQLQGMDESLKEKSREGLLDSPDSGLPPSPSPPFYSLSPGEGRAGGGSSGADPPAQGHRREAKDGKVVRAGEGREGEKRRESRGAGGTARTRSLGAPSAPPGLRGTAGGFLLCSGVVAPQRGDISSDNKPESEARSSVPSCSTRRSVPAASSIGCAPASRIPPGPQCSHVCCSPCCKERGKRWLGQGTGGCPGSWCGDMGWGSSLPLAGAGFWGVRLHGQDWSGGGP